MKKFRLVMFLMAVLALEGHTYGGVRMPGAGDSYSDLNAYEDVLDRLFPYPATRCPDSFAEYQIVLRYSGLGKSEAQDYIVVCTNGDVIITRYRLDSEPIWDAMHRKDSQQVVNSSKVAKETFTSIPPDIRALVYAYPTETLPKLRPANEKELIEHTDGTTLDYWFFSLNTSTYLSVRENETRTSTVDWIKKMRRAIDVLKIGRVGE